jgi:type I restriction enzyme R subunit
MRHEGFCSVHLEIARGAPYNYISIYDIARAVEDGATVPIYYEGRLAKLELSEVERPKIDPDFEEVTEGEEVEHKEGLKSK